VRQYLKKKNLAYYLGDKLLLIHPIILYPISFSKKYIFFENILYPILMEEICILIEENKNIPLID
jgi:hypothetical protein